MQKHIIVIGGGMAGTSAARSLRSQGYDVTILEKNDRLGGRTRSESVDGAAVEMGAGFITKAYTNIRAFLSDTGLGEHLYRGYGNSGILRGGKIKMATVSALAGNETLSWGAKLQTIPPLLKTLLGWRSINMQAPWRAEKYDTQAVSDMFYGKAGKELLEYVLQPILNGYFYWTPERTSSAILLVIIKALLMGGTRKLAGGLQQMPEKAAEGCEVLLGCNVQRVRKNSDGTFTVVMNHRNKTRDLQADGVVCATTASVVTNIILDLTTRQKDFFESIKYSSTAVLAETYPVAEILGDKGLAFPRKENNNLAAITASPEMGDNGVSLGTVKVYASGRLGEALQNASAKDVTTQLRKEREPFRSAVLTDDAEPLATHLQKWPEALPIFDHGHFKKLRQFADGKIETQNDNLVFAGDYLGGPFMEGAFTSGMQAAARLHARFEQA